MGQSQLSHIVALLERCAKKRGWTHVNTQLLSSFFLFFNLTVTHKYTSKQRNNISPFVQFRQLKDFINDSSHEWKHFWQTYRTWDLHLGSTPLHTRGISLAEAAGWSSAVAFCWRWDLCPGRLCSDPLSIPYSSSVKSEYWQPRGIRLLTHASQSSKAVHF